MVVGVGQETLEEFQFHKGTIETKEKRPKQNASDIFQFHKGTIET